MNKVVLENVKNKILDLVTSITPHDSLEQNHINDTRSWIKSGEQIFRINKPDDPNKHLVSYFIMFDEFQKKILLVDHKQAGLWLPSGGHVELNENPTDTVKRECIEELSVTANFWSKKPIFITQTITVGKTAGHTDVSLWYVLNGDSNTQYDYDHREFSRIKWFSFDKIPYNRSDPHMHRFISKLQKIL